MKILAVDDNTEGLFILEKILTDYGFSVVTAENALEALSYLDNNIPDLILTDVMMPEMNGFELTEKVKAHPLLRYVPVVLLTSRDTIEDLYQGFDRGADDYITKPYVPDELVARIRALTRMKELYQELKDTIDINSDLKRKVKERYSFSNIIGESSKIMELFELMDRVKDSDVPVLITGESGTGKELIAAALHFNSIRERKPFVAQNCSAFNDNLLESELFGHVKGSFTGAHVDKKGLFEIADGGTFLLDEVGDMSPSMQVKLLRVLQTGNFTAVGDTKERSSKVRIVAATNRNLKKMIEAGSFREDLYYRLNVVNLEIPPLRERVNDIPLLIDHFISNYAQRNHQQKKRLAKDVLIKLLSYRWPGNIRELENEIERLAVLSGSDEEICLPYLSEHIKRTTEALPAYTSIVTLKQAVEETERKLITRVLTETNGNKSEAAKLLQISRTSLIKKAKYFFDD